MSFACTILVSSVALLAACGTAVRPADGDAQLDVTNRDDALDARDLLDEAGFDAALDVREDVQTNGDVFFERFDDTPDSVDAGVPRDVPIDIPPAEASCAEPGARPLRSLRSCSGMGGAPIEHCREVWACGGAFRMGSTAAWAQPIGQPLRRQAEPCDIQRVDVHPSYIDAYEVSVARFRAWVRAGFPQPARGVSLWFAGSTVEPWMPQTFVEPFVECRSDGSCRPNPLACTYRANSPENDDLPINCLSTAAMQAFCWWEGKHLVSDALWEYVATNGGRTALPFSGRSPDWYAHPCDFGDVDGCSPSSTLPRRIDAFPLGQSDDPRGVFALWGGLSELVYHSSRRTSQYCLEPGSERASTTPVIGCRRGRNYLDPASSAATERFDHSSTWTHFSAPTNAAVGFRCARWVPEPFAPET